MSVKRQPQIPLSRAPREDVVGAVAAGATREETRGQASGERTSAANPAATPQAQRGRDHAPQPARRVKKRLVTFTNRLDPDLLDWMARRKDEDDVTIAAQLDEAVRDYIEKVTGSRP